MVGSVIESDEIQDLFPASIARAGGHIELWGSDRKLIAQTTHPTVPVDRVVESAYFTRILTGRSGTAVITSPLTGQSELIGFAPVPSTPWTIATGTARAIALQPIYRSLAIFLALTIIVLTLTLFWSLYSAGQFARQIQALVDGARAIGRGKPRYARQPAHRQRTG